LPAKPTQASERRRFGIRSQHCMTGVCVFIRASPQIHFEVTSLRGNMAAGELAGVLPMCTTCMRTLSSLVVASFFSAVAVGQCDWERNIHQGVTPSGGRATVLYDPDGAGPLPLMLVVGGHEISAAGLDFASRIAAYDGEKWMALGAGVNNATDTAHINALAVYNGELIAAGEFETAGGQPAQRIARWNGSAWSPLGSGLNGEVLTLAVYSGEVYAGGNFAVAGGIFANRIARWNGTSWNSVGTGITGGVALVNGMAVMNGRLYVGGEFNAAGGVSVNNLASWDGSTWSNPGNVNGRVNAVTAHHHFTLSDSLYISGAFTSVAGISANRVARLTGVFPAWSAMGSGLPDIGQSPLFVRNTGPSTHEVLATVVVGGSPRLLRWTGSVWSEFLPVLPGTLAGSLPGALAYYNGQYIYAGRGVVSCFDVTNNAWARLGPGFDAALSDMVVFGNELFFTGSFTYVAHQRSRGVIRWNGTEFLPVAGGVDTQVRSATVFNDALWIGGTFTTAGMTPTNSVARWDGSGWDAVGLPAPGDVLDMEVHDGELYICGSILGGRKAAKWIGSGWSPVDAGLALGSTAKVLKSYGGHLFVGGMSVVSGNPIARFDAMSSHWSALPETTFLRGSAEDMEVFQGRMYICGWRFDDDETIGVLRLDSPTGPPLHVPEIANVGMGSPIVRAMHVYQNALYFSGMFSQVDGQSASGFARFDGTNWMPLGVGLQHFLATGGFEVMSEFQNELLIGGTVSAAGGHVSRPWARWRCPAPCYANCDQSTTAPVLNVEDFICFINEFAAATALAPSQQMSHYANCDGSMTTPVVNVEDFVCFINRFAAGCS
jgi:trimeric autotransporter adhesin